MANIKLEKELLDKICNGCQCILNNVDLSKLSQAQIDNMLKDKTQVEFIIRQGNSGNYPHKK